jgi:hypothetical protein
MEEDNIEVDNPRQMEGIKTTMVGNDDRRYRSASASVFLTGSSRTPTQPTSEDDREGGISDDDGEKEEQKNLSRKAMHPETLKSYYYGGRSKAVGTGVSVIANIEFAAYVFTIDPLSCPHCPHDFSSHLRKAKHKFPRCRCPHVAQKG